MYRMFAHPVIDQARRAQSVARKAAVVAYWSAHTWGTVFSWCLRLALLLAACHLPTAHAELIPSERFPRASAPYWRPGANESTASAVGVIGGIDQYADGVPTTGRNTADMLDVTASPYNADNTGATDARSDIQAAVSDCIAAGSGCKGVYLPAGTYRVDSNILLDYSFNNKTMRGAGRDQTTIDQRGGAAIVIGETSDPAPPNLTPLTVVAGMTQGSTSVTTDGGDLSNLSVGQIIFFLIENDTSLPVVSVYNFDVWTNQSPMNQAVRITSKGTDTINFTPPLLADYPGTVRVVRTPFAYSANIGLEDLAVTSVNHPGETNCVRIFSTYNSWIKNCDVHHLGNYPISVGYCLRTEFRHCRINGVPNSGSNHAGLLFGGWSCLVEDNEIDNSFPIVEVNTGAAGNAFLYNFGGPTQNWTSNHAPHNNLNLMEGNSFGFHVSDGYFGSEGNLTIFRNYMHGPYGSSLRRFTRNTSEVGNIVNGAPRIGDDGWPFIAGGHGEGTAQLSMGDPWMDWYMTATLTTRTDDNNGEITLISGHLSEDDGFSGDQVIAVRWGSPPINYKGCTVTSVDPDTPPGQVAIITGGGTPLPAEGTVVTIGPGSFSSVFGASFQEQDLDVAATTIQKGNRFTEDDSYQSLGGDPIPDSYAYEASPEWWPSSLPWPPFDAAAMPYEADITGGDGVTYDDADIRKFTSASASFTLADVGRAIYGTGITLGTCIVARVDAHTVTLSQDASSAGSGRSFVVTGPGWDRIPAGYRHVYGIDPDTTPEAPVNTVAPTITGTAETGLVLTAHNGTWTGVPFPSFTYQWQTCDSSCATCDDIDGATSSTYTVQVGDLGSKIRLLVLGTNTEGDDTGTSACTATVTTGGSPSTPRLIIPLAH